MGADNTFGETNFNPDMEKGKLKRRGMPIFENPPPPPLPPAEGAKTCWNCGIELRYSPNGVTAYHCACGAVNPEERQPQPIAEGAEEINVREYLDYWMRQHNYPMDKLIGFSIAADFAYDFATLHIQRIVEGAEEIDDETIAYAAEHQCGTPFSERWIGFIKGAKWHRSLHAQKIADKMVEERMREELAKFYLYVDRDWALGMLPERVDEVIDEYLKSRER